MRMKIILLLLSCVLVSHSGYSRAAVKKTQTKSSPKKILVDEVFNKYKNAKFVTLDVKKKIKSELLGKVQIYQGQIFLSHKLFRWDTETPDKTQLIFDGENIWNVQYPPKEMKSQPQVAKMKVDKNTRKQILLSQLLNQEALSKNFKILKEENVDLNSLVSLEPKTKDLNIKNLKVKIENKKKELVLISYMDDLGNLTEIEITKTTFSNEKKANFFKYQPPQGVTVTHL